MSKAKLAPLLMLLAIPVYGDDSSVLLDQLDSSIHALSETSNACETAVVSWPFNRADIHIGVAGSYGIHDVLDLTVSLQVVFAFVRKGHAPD